MKFFILILCIFLEISSSVCNIFDNDECNYEKVVNETIAGILALKSQSEIWQFADNSNSYKGGEYSPNVAIPDGIYDFVICGGGTAANLMANRLSTFKGLPWTVLVLEAGGNEETDITKIPNVAPNLKTSNLNWRYLTTPQKDAFAGYIGNKVPTSHGRTLGGSSAINLMSYVRPSEDDFNEWGKLNPGWTFNEVLPYLKKTENATFSNANTSYHGTSGELKVGDTQDFNKMGEAFLSAFSETGRNVSNDYNAESRLVASKIKFIQDEGKRLSSSSAFLTSSIRSNPNLFIYLNTFITKLLINNDTKQVYGVQYTRGGIMYEVIARNEVILCSGAVNLAQLLMLSGIGPKEHLENFNIPVVLDLPGVGSNLWDYLVYSHNVYQMNITEPQLDLKQQVEKYLNVSGRSGGPLTNPLGIQAISFCNLTGDIVQYLFHSSTDPEDDYNAFKNLEGYTQETYDTVIKPTLGVFKWGLYIIGLYPNCRGTVRLQSASPYDFPVIIPNYFCDSSDIDPFIKAINDTMNIAQTEAFQKYNSTLIKVCHPSCDCNNWGTDAFWRCMVKNLAKSFNQLSGTTKMGPKTDSTAVVDTNLQVHEMKGIRIVSKSVVPNTMSGSDDAITYLIAEKAVSIITEAYSVKFCH